MRRRFAPLLIAASSLAAAIVVACSLVIDTNGLSGGAAGAEDSGEGGGEAAADAVADATDALSPMDTGVVRPCAVSTHELCDDFDEGPLGARWGRVTQTPNTSIAVTDAGSVSAPNALEIVLPAVADAGGKRTVYLAKTFSGSVKAVDISFDIRPETLTGFSTNYVDLSVDPSPPEPTYYVVGLAAAPTSATLFEYAEQSDGGYTEHDYALGVLPLRTWTHVRFLVTIAAPATYELFIDGKRTATGPLSPPAHTGITVRIGATYVNEPAGPERLLIDNVTIDRTL